MTLTVKHSSGTSGVLQEIPSTQLGEALTGNDLLWVDVIHPDDDDLATLRTLQVPPLVLEDIAQKNQTVTLRHFGETTFVVFYAFSCSGEDIDHFPLSIFVTGHTLVTIRQIEIPALQDQSSRWRQDVLDIGQNTPVTLLYSLLDAMVDSYFPVLDEIADRVADIEDRILRGRDDDVQGQIVAMRRSLLVTRRILAAEREALIKVFHNDHPASEAALRPYFQDVYDHVNRATDTLDGAREMLTSAMDSYVSLVNNELNVVVRRLTSWTIILMVVTLVAGIYGMNFDNMPELHWRFGYLYALGLMVLLVTAMTLIFRRIRWL